MKKLVKESLNEYLSAPENILATNQEWLEDSEVGEIGLSIMSEYIPIENLYWVGYGDPEDPEEEERVQKIMNLIKGISPEVSNIPVETDEFDGGDITVFKLGDIVVIEWFDGAHESNWFTNMAGLEKIM